MEHFYQHINGFMNHRNTIMLDLVLDKFPAGGTWVELGSWTGRSAAYCVVELINRQKIGKFHCVDHWQGQPDIAYDPKIVQNLRQIFCSNLSSVIDQINLIDSCSWDAAQQFYDQSVDFCYVDAGHDYESVTRDLQAWWPKMRDGSHFAGDDYTKGYPGVQQAVWDFFSPQNIPVSRSGRCWIVTKPIAPCI
jgi:hypothetical protein